MKVLAGCEVLNVEWQVSMPRRREHWQPSAVNRKVIRLAHTRPRVGGRVAATLADEPGLRQSLVSRIEAQLAARASV